MSEVFELKQISASAIGAALERAERYRLLNEPVEAESICHDVLATDPDNQRALVFLLLALTDQFEGSSKCLPAARELLAQLQSEYEREYYSGVICEREAKVILGRSIPGSGSVAYEWLRRAMEKYERAEQLRTAGNDEATLRWNTCARIIMNNPSIKREDSDDTPLQLE